MAPLTQSKPWNGNFVGMERFCQNVSSMVENAIKENRKQNKETSVYFFEHHTRCQFNID
jgi:leucyl-tRNA synthetase